MVELPVLDPNPMGAEREELLRQEILSLAQRHRAVILAHNYQVPAIQRLAHFTGDSLQLSREAARADAERIIFCGVHFMAETAAILAPDKIVHIPDLRAGCSLADSITADQLRRWKSQHPGAIVVMYVNTSAEVKAEADYCVTSSNAVAVCGQIIDAHPDAEILFGPDMWLGSYVHKTLGCPGGFHVWAGECHVHAGIRPADIETIRGQQPQAQFLVHPECGCSTQVMEFVAAGDMDAEDVHMLSTGQMLDHLRREPDGEFIVATEIGMLHPLSEAAPNARLSAANPNAACRYMKMITLENVRDTLRDLTGVVTVPSEVARRALLPIERMVVIG